MMTWIATGRTIRTTTVDTTVTTNTFGETFNSSSSDALLATEVIPFMRSIDIQFVAENFKPYSRLYPFWDGVDVGSQCKQDGKAYGDALVTDAAGKLSGTYTVPNTVDFHFKTGTSLFRLSDSPANSYSPDDYTTQGSVMFYSGGDLTTRQVTIVNTRTLINTQTVTSSRTSSTNLIEPPRVDPIAQSFVVTSAGGAYITKVDIFFKNKSDAIPVQMQIRPVVNGYPAFLVMPFGMKTLYPADVNVSEDGTVPTSFVFDDPIYLEENKEYAIVLVADTQEYDAFIAQMGENVIGQEAAVSKQPNIGVFFTSSNGSTWSANQNQDLKFRIYKAKFNTAAQGQVVFNCKDPIALPIKRDALQTTNGSNQITMYMRSHSLKAGDTFTLSGAAAGNGLTAAQINKDQVVISATLDRVVFAVSSNANVTGSFGGTAMKAKANYSFATILSNFEFLELPGTSIKWELNYRRQDNRQMTGWQEYLPKRTFQLDAEGAVVAAGDVQVRATLTTNNANLSPMVDSLGLTTALYQKRVNNDPADPAQVYLTQPIRFNNPSTSARFYVGAKLPAGSNMRFYYKAITTPDEDITNKAWSELQPLTPVVNDSTAFKEYEYQLNNIGSFVGYVLKVVLLATDPTKAPELSDVRSIALA